MTAIFTWLKSFGVLWFSLAILGWPIAAFANNKVALVIGNAFYDHGPNLRTPINDTDEIAKSFVRLGYDTVLLQNAKTSEMLRALAELRIRSSEAEKVVIYFAGHGLHRMGQSYLLNSDSRFSGSGMHRSMVPVHVLIKAVSDKTRQKLIFIDACRDNPAYYSTVEDPQLVSTMPTPAGSYVLYSAQPGAAAYDGTGIHSPFAKSFLKQLEASDEITTIARRLRFDVIQSTQGKQVPWSLSSLMRPAFLR